MARTKGTGSNRLKLLTRQDFRQGHTNDGLNWNAVIKRAKCPHEIAKGEKKAIIKTIMDENGEYVNPIEYVADVKLLSKDDYIQSDKTKERLEKKTHIYSGSIKRDKGLYKPFSMKPVLMEQKRIAKEKKAIKERMS